jgi:hypothetical protein
VVGGVKETECKTFSFNLRDYFSVQILSISVGRAINAVGCWQVRVTPKLFLNFVNCA